MNHRAPAGGADEYDKHYLGGQFMPFYVPRERMPQFSERDYPRLVRDAYSCSFETVPTMDLHAHQRINHHLAQAMDARDRIKPIIVSADNYIVDGNHRWWASVYSGTPWMNVIRLKDNFDTAVAWALSLPYVTEIKPTRRYER